MMGYKHTKYIVNIVLRKFNLLATFNLVRYFILILNIRLKVNITEMYKLVQITKVAANDSHYDKLKHEDCAY